MVWMMLYVCVDSRRNECVAEKHASLQRLDCGRGTSYRYQQLSLPKFQPEFFHGGKVGGKVVVVFATFRNTFVSFIFFT